jgi:hypothetical protein
LNESGKMLTNQYHSYYTYHIYAEDQEGDGEYDDREGLPKPVYPISTCRFIAPRTLDTFAVPHSGLDNCHKPVQIREDTKGPRRKHSTGGVRKGILSFTRTATCLYTRHEPAYR